MQNVHEVVVDRIRTRPRRFLNVFFISWKTRVNLRRYYGKSESMCIEGRKNEAFLFLTSMGSYVKMEPHATPA